MLAPKQPTDEDLLRAAELRAEGKSWEAIGKELGRSASTVRRWEQRFARRWVKLLQSAEKRLMSQATGEAVTALRQQLRGEDGKAARDAAQKLIQLRIVLERARMSRQRKKPVRKRGANTEGRRIAHHLEALTDGQIDALLREIHEENGTAGVESSVSSDPSRPA